MTPEAASPRRPIAFWLIPAAADHALLTARMTALALTHEAPRFEPHVTLHVDTAAARSDVASRLASIAATVPPIRLPAGDTGHSANYFRTLFIDFDGPAANRFGGVDALQALQRQLAATLWCEPASDEAATRKAISGYPLQPHLSLLYAPLGEARRATLAESERFADHIFTFDTVAAVRPAAGFDDMSEVARWDVFGHCALGG